jgi:AraC-like DNA-binding protein/tetratricopeptide (TPR) repeat protein
MFKRLICFFWIVLISCLVSLPSAGQTIKERSDKAYASLSVSQGQTMVELLNELTSYRSIDSINRAVDLARRAVQESQKLKNQFVLAKSLLILSSVYIQKDQLDSAASYLRQAGNIFEKFPGSKNTDLYFFNQGVIRFKQNSHKEAIALFKKSLPLSEKAGNYTLLGRTYLYIAKSFKKIGQSQEYLVFLNKADQSFRKANDPVQVGPILIGLGICYLDLGLVEKANEQFISAVRMCEITSDNLFLGYLYMNISTIYTNTSAEKSVEYYGEAMKIFRALKNDKAIAYCLNLKGIGHLSAKEYSKSLPIFKEAAVLKEKSSDWQGASFAYGNMVIAYLGIKQPLKAAAALKSADAMCKKAGDKLSLAAFLQSKGAYNTYIKEFGKALECYSLSTRSAKEIHVQEIVTDNLLSISEMYQQKGDAAEALKYYKMYTSTRDSVLRASNVASIADLQLKYETEKKDSQIRELINSKLKSEQGRYYIIGNIVAVILLLFAVIIFFFRLKGNYAQRLQFMLTIRRQVNLQRDKARELLLPGMSDKATKTGLTQKLQENLWLQLKTIMETDKLFLRSDLTLSELARKLNTNTSYLSKVINDITQQNFSNYLNQYRIEEACKILSEPGSRNLTIEGIAQTVGFNSKSAFNAAFKKIKNATPSEYLIAQNEEIELLA